MGELRAKFYVLQVHRISLTLTMTSSNLLHESQFAWNRGLMLGAVVVNRDNVIIDLTEGVLAESGMPRSELVGRSAIDLVHPDDLHRAAAVLDEVGHIPGARPEGLYRLKLADGSYREFTICATNLGPEQDDQIVLALGRPTDELRAQAFTDDVVDVMRMLSEDISLEDSMDWVAKVAERHVPGLQIVITLLDEGGQNKLMSRGPIPEELEITNRAARADALPIHVDVAFDDFSKRSWRASNKIASLDYILPGRLTSILASRNGDLVGYVEALRTSSDAPSSIEWPVHGMISRMMTAALHRHEFDQQLRRAADLDPLTGLLNRRKLFEVLGGDTNLAGSLLYLIDLDRFSWVNNNLGHQAGDETLIAIAHVLLQACPPRSLIARLGGDEFVVWIPADQASHDLEELGETIIKAMVVPAGEGEKQVWVRGSIGMIRVAPGEAAADAVNRADVAMYASKRSGGDVATVG